MEHVLHLSTTWMLVVPLAAAVLCAGVATTTYALIDSGLASPSKVVITLPSGVH
jgi:predicted class III extradiol MEMO1 family dioxygenase